jgi:hypothetical protein
MGLVDDPSILIQIPIWVICGIFIRRNKSRVAAGALLAFAIIGMGLVLLMQGPISGMLEKGFSIALFFRAFQATSKLHKS